MTDPSEDDNFEEPASLRFLRRLVTVLTAVMICGFIVLIGIFVTRYTNPGPRLPEEIALPDGVRASAITFGDGWYAVVTQDNRILIFEADGRLRKELSAD